MFKTTRHFLYTHRLLAQKQKKVRVRVIHKVIYQSYMCRKFPRKTGTYESVECVPCNTRNCNNNGFVSDLLK